jgi:hypothetical protein
MAPINPDANLPRPLYCTCRGEHAGPAAECGVHGETFEIDITTANNLIAEWTHIARSIAQQCQWRPQGQCLATCKGLALCNLDGLILVDAQGQPVAQTSPAGQASSGAGVSPALLNPDP